jgi:hypothetical protein
MSDRSTGISLTVKEKIQLHLLEHAKFSDEYSVPPEVTQSGISERVGIHLKHLSQYLKPLLEAGHVEERTAHVTGKKQRQKVYNLTSVGWVDASKVKDLVMGSPINYMTASGAPGGRADGGHGEVLSGAPHNGGSLRDRR